GALAAINGRIERDAITHGKTGNTRSQRGDGPSGFMSHHNRRNPASRGTIIAMHVAATNTAGRHLNEYFTASGLRRGQIRQFEATIFGKQQSSHFAVTAWVDAGATIPPSSRMVRIWLAFTCVKRSIFCVVGHFTSITSTTDAFPNPKCKRKSLCDITLD